MNPDEIIKLLNTELVPICLEKIDETIAMNIRKHNIKCSVDCENVIRIEIDDRVFSLRPNFEECPF